MIQETTNKRFLKYLKRLIAGADTLLDIGSGPGHLLKEMNARMIVALDVHRPYLENMAAHSAFIIPVNADAKDVSKLFVSRSFDVVTLIDVLEHFTKEDGLEVLRQAESVAKERVVLFTPRGFFPQSGIDHYGMNGEVYQTHRSGWEPEELEELGYDVIIMKGLHDRSNLAFLEAFGEDHEPVDALFAVKHIK
ncbi:class I SAM-dependent methyltransferase [Paenibacillus pasadenensis]|uniref:class I SAM-dependent methyltransferase n=1 Tax=Paenibacillus pasadenensis TaxID=217090 RepID=UPI00203D627A|nr:class I SAM-dependent methyltransferase [Paenibacillus pasadenensis]MCM3747708.1 class I SAM-dependent methyltransferase [Paenibacillus pasadenensis]